MDPWDFKLKQYPHFDAPISKARIRALVTDPARVAKNAYLPFIRFKQEWQPFRRSPRPKRKEREIRYASRRDAAIYSYYRHILAGPYEARVAKESLTQNVLAYRRIVDSVGRGKSNIEFARDAFLAVRGMGDCIVLALDISKFFDSIDHSRLRKVWASLLGVAELPADHASVFSNITNYADVDRDLLYEKLKLAKWEKIGSGKRLRLAVPRKDLPIQLCSMADFRRVVAGKGTATGIIEKHALEYGIPQGAPLSDLLANAYLLDFDIETKAWVEGAGGVYLRYSDDILLILPGADASLAAVYSARVSSSIKKAGPKIEISAKKTSAYRFWSDSSRSRFEHLIGKGKNGLEYLGFRFDGQFAYIKDGTLSALHRKITYGARGAAYAHVARYPGKTLSELQALFDLSAFLRRYGRVRDFNEVADYRDWTFWTYGVKSKKAMGSLGARISGQLSRYREFGKKVIREELEDALAKRSAK